MVAPEPAAPVVVAPVASAPPAPPAAPAAPAQAASDVAEVRALHSEPFALPGATAPVSLDYLFFEPQAARVWVPAGGTGSVAVFDVASHAFAQVVGFKTVEREMHGKKRVLGPSSGSIGEGVAYVGNRATGEVCVVDLHTLKTRSCLKLPSAPDGVELCPSTHEVWVTTPSTQSLLVLDASKPGQLKQKSVIKLDGAPEGYAIDEARGLFLTNLEDKGSTLTIDVQTHAVKDVWSAACGSDGPRGIAVDSARGLVMVACTDHVQVLDQKNKGALLGKLDTGAGLDNLDYVASSKLLYAAAGKAARLTVAELEDDGRLIVRATAETAPGARNAVVDAAGNAYLADGQAARLLLVSAAAH
ncbi:MAG TPA: hypothetical protein VGL19_20775 [Polyangiaceae bacterium]